MKKDIYINPKVEIILPQQTAEGQIKCLSAKVKLINKEKNEILIYPTNIDVEHKRITFTISCEELKIINTVGEAINMNL